MNVLFENVQVFLPYFLGSWLLFIVCTLRNPQKYSNSFFLMIALFFTCLFICGLFGEDMGYALVGMFIIILIAIFLVPAMLIYNGIVMIKKESFCLAHVLSLLLGIAIGIGEVACVVMVIDWGNNRFFTSFGQFNMWLTFTAIYFSCMVLNFVLYSIFIQYLPYQNNFEYIIIHGCGLINGNQMTKLLSNRVDKAIEVYQKSIVKPIIIPSGGKGEDEALSEAEAMAIYLKEKGISDEHILLEDQSKTTMENLIFSKEIINQRGGSKKIALVSSNYHIYRCLCYAKKIGLKNCRGLGAKVAIYYWPTATIREFVAVLKRPSFIVWTIIGYIIYMLPMYVFFWR